MTLQASGAISMSQINAEFGRGNNLNAYRGTTWYTDAGGSGTFSSGAISFSEFYSKRPTNPSGTFSPDGGSSSGSRVSLSSTEQGTTSFIYITCTQSATWSYTQTNGSFGGANVASGGSASSITFSLPVGATNRASNWTLDATSGSNTRYWFIELITLIAGCARCCFTPDTLIRMADMSQKPIGEIQEGEFILVFDELTNSTVAVPVSEVIVRENNVMYELTFDDGTTLNSSEDHPIFVVGKGYSSINPTGIYKDIGVPSQLEIGDRVSTLFGTTPRLTGMKLIDYPHKVYTFGNSRFYANGVLVY